MSPKADLVLLLRLLGRVVATAVDGNDQTYLERMCLGLGALQA